MSMTTEKTTQGLLHAFLFDGRGGGHKFTWEDIRKWQPEDGLLWIHLSYTSDEAALWLSTESGLDLVVIDALLSEETRPRATVVGKGLLLSLRGINLNPGSSEEDMVSVRIWADENRIISTRKRQLLSVEQVTRNILAGNGPESTGEFLNSFIEQLTSYIEDTIDVLESTEEEIEEKVADVHTEDLRSEISVIRRKAILLRRYLAPQREALMRIQTENLSWFRDKDKRYLYETTNHLTRLVEDLDSIRDRAMVAQEETLNMLSQQLNSRMYMLTLLTAIFLPLSFLTGLLGINVGGIPGGSSPYGFWAIVGLLGCILMVQILYFRKKGWL